MVLLLSVKIFFSIYVCTAQQLIHIEVVDEPVPLYDQVTEGIINRAFSLVFNQTIRDRHFPFEGSTSDFEGPDFIRARQIQRQTNIIDELCDSWIAKCPLVM